MSAAGSFIWYELMASDATAAAKFYGAVVGWKIADRSDPPGGNMDYRGVQSITTAKAAIEMGSGSVVNGPHQVPGGDWVVIAVDQQGAAFGVVGPQGAQA